MGELIAKFQNALIVWCRVLSLALRDRRLPNIVRILIWLAALYVICPIDFKPDFLPGGLIDDEIIAPILLAMAFFSIPKGVLADAKRLANKATCSFVCVAISSTSLTACELSLTVPVAMTIQAHAYSSSVNRSDFTFSSKDETPSINAQLGGTTAADESEMPDAVIGNSFEDHSSKFRSGVPNCPASWMNWSVVSEMMPAKPVPVPFNNWQSSHGKQMRLCCSGDDPDSSSIVLVNACPFGPPCVQGGSFYAPSSIAKDVQ